MENQSPYDIRAPIDIETSPQYSWLRVLPDPDPSVIRREVHKLCGPDQRIPALLIRRTSHDLEGPIQDVLGAINKPARSVEMFGDTQGRPLSSFHYDDPPDLLAIQPHSWLHVRIADSYVLANRMLSQDLEALHKREYVVDGVLKSILERHMYKPGSTVCLPADHAAITTLNDSARNALNTLESVFAFPGCVLEISLSPRDVLILNNRRCLQSCSGSCGLNNQGTIATIHYWRDAPSVQCEGQCLGCELSAGPEGAD